METIYFARWILLENSKILQNGAITVSNNSISFIGPRSKARKKSSTPIINLGDTLLIPGLINMHTHLEEACMRGIQKNADETFATWSAKKRSRLRQYSKEQIKASMQLSVRELLSNGITSVVDSSKMGYSAELLENEPIRSWVAHEFFPENASQENESIKDFIHEYSTIPYKNIKRAIGPYSLYSTAPDILNNISTFSRHNRIPWICHVAESAEELQAFAENRGDLFFQITRKRSWPYGETHLGSLRYALDNYLIPHRGICIHCNYAGGSELSELAARDVTIVHCPIYSHEMNHKTLPIDVVLNRNVRLCVGTEGESIPGAMNLFDELFHLKQRYPHIPAREMIKWVTSNPASALGVEKQLGTLSVGKRADIVGIQFSFDDSKDLLEQMLQSDQEIKLVMVNGQEIIVNY